MPIQRVALVFDDQARPETTGVYCLRALRELVQVEHFRPADINGIPRRGFDLYLSIDDGLDYRLPKDLRPCARWVIDTHLNFARDRVSAADFDLVFAAQQDGAEQLRRAGIASASWLPLACDPEIHARHEAAKAYDLCFVGNVFPGPRSDLLLLLRQRFPRMFVGRRYFEEMARTYSASRVVFNRSVRSDVNMRVFEAVACGSLLMTNDLAENGQAELFRDGVHLAAYRDADELVDKTAFYLAKEASRERVAAAGRAEALAKHTYRRRMETLLAEAERSLVHVSVPLAVAAPSSHPSRPDELSGGAPRAGTPLGPDRSYYEFARPELLARIPTSARRILDIGCGTGRLGEAVKARQDAEVIGVELDPEAAAQARGRLDRVLCSDAEELEKGFAPGIFDAVVCGDVLEHLHDPEGLLLRARTWLAPEGRLIASIPNVRHHSVLRGLLAGDWTYESAGLLDRTHLRFFTRRSIQDLFARCGYEVEAVEAVPGPGDEGQDRQSGTVNVGRLHIEGLAPEEAGEYFTYQHLVTARGRRPPSEAAPAREGPRPGQAADRPALVWRRTAGTAGVLTGHSDSAAPAAEAGLLPAEAAEILELTGDPQALRGIGEVQGVIVGRPEADEFAPEPGAFDAILCGRSLEQVRDPDRLLSRARGWLRPGGCLLARVGNTRRAAVVRGLLEGAWDGASRPRGVDRIRFYTRREVEKIFFRAGFAVDELRGVATDDSRAAETSTAAEVNLGPLRIRGLDAGEADEYLTAEYLVRALVRPQPDHGLTSIVIVAHNQLAYTRLCLDAIRRYTDEPYEVIVVDNASTDGTPEYLRSLGGVALLRNDANRGFPAAANQGMRAAQGAQVLLLNNDTVVTTGWLRRMLDALHADPAAGLVGPCSNRVSGEQQVPAGYDDDLVGLDGFAWEWGKANDRRRQATDRLVGFCLLIRREVIDRIGFLDERFGVGCFEDDDYCLRATRAGFRAVIARDGFVHHFGGRTFVGSGVDFAGLMRRNQGLFEDKWRSGAVESNAKRPTEVRMRPRQPCGPFTVRRAPDGGLLLALRPVHLSLCMIVRDNARTIEACLTSIRPWVDEMCVVDTGSVDDTPTIAARLGARVFSFPWCDSFSAARNESLRHARGRWVFWMDSDDVICPENGRKLRELIARDPGPSVLGFVVQVHCPGSGRDGHLNMTVVDHVKLFRNLPHLRFEGRIHEQVLPAIRRSGGETAWTDVYVVHAGYDHTPEGQEHKKRRDLRLLHLELEDWPNHPFTLFNLGMTHADVGDYAPAVDFLNRSIRRSGEGESHLRKAYALLTYCHARLGRPDQAREACERGLKSFPEDVELRFRRALLLHEAGRLGESAAAYREVLNAPGERYFTSVDRGVRGFKARQNLALVYADLGDLAQSEEQWLLVVKEAPRYGHGWRGLGEVLLRRGKRDEAAVLAERLAAEDGLRADGLLLCGRVAEARGNWAEAKRLLQEAAAALPDDPETLEACCRFLFEHGNPAEAAAALEGLLKVRPEDAAAHHNLGTVYVRQGRAGAAIDAYRRSLALRPESAVTWARLGDALRDIGRAEEAADAWGRAARLDPGNAETPEPLRRARQADAPEQG